MASRTRFIVNPAAGGGAHRKYLKQIETYILRHPSAEMTFTSRAGQATELTQAALHDGADTIVAVGGDGTIHEVVNGWFVDGRAINTNARLGIISAGTGGDFVRSLRVPAFASANDYLGLLETDQTRMCDVGRIECMGRSRYFINIADAGFGGELVARLSDSLKNILPSIAYFTGLFRTLISHRNRKVKIMVDGQPAVEQKILAVVIANGQFFGGGMQATPQAKLDDGLFEVIIVGDIGKAEILSNVHRLYNGALLQHPKVESFRAKKISLSAEEEVLLDVDGELAGRLPANFEILQRRMKIIDKTIDD